MVIAIDETQVYEAIKDRDVVALCSGLEGHLARQKGAHASSHLYGTLRMKLHHKMLKYRGRQMSVAEYRKLHVDEYNRLMEFLVQGAEREWWNPFG